LFATYTGDTSLEEDISIFTFNHILFVPPTKNPGPVRMGHTPYARYIYLGFDSEVSWGCVNYIIDTI
jgi:hypothetical protein